MGKGRDMGFDSINAFELKTSSKWSDICACACAVMMEVLSHPPPTSPAFSSWPDAALLKGGAGNIVISRDLWRLATRLDLFRCMHFFYSGCG